MRKSLAEQNYIERSPRLNFTNQAPIYVVSSVMGAELANGVFRGGRDSLYGWVDMVEDILLSPLDDGVPIGMFTTDFQASLVVLFLGITSGLVGKVVVMIRESIVSTYAAVGI
jgi:hypothetical protein